MTKDIAEDHFVEDKRLSSHPINIPGIKVSQADHIEDDLPSLNESPINSAGDSVENSPKLPRPSPDFDHVMIDLKDDDVIRQVHSGSGATLVQSDDNLSPSLSQVLISSVEREISQIQKSRKKVTFDESTITLIADLGESAARYRSRWRQKKTRGTFLVRFGESKNITVQHDDLVEMSSPEVERKPEKAKSIFEACDYSSYGRYT